MANDVKLPRLGQGMEAGTIVRWLKSEGDRVEKGEPLYELDTDKVTQEVEADFGGVLLKIAVPEGEVAVGRTIAVIGEQGEDVSVGDDERATDETPPPGAAESDVPGVERPAQAPKREAERERGREASAPDDQVTEIKQTPSRQDGGRVKASPLARRIARERGIDLAAIGGTGPEGRVVAEDVERAAAAPAPGAAAPLPAAGEVEVEQLSSMRRTIARRLTEAWQAPVFQISMTADMTRARELHERLAEAHAESPARPTLTDLLTKACATALMRHRAVNAHFREDAVHLFPSANIGIAVAVPGGLVVPVIAGCERRTVADLAAARAAVVARAREGRLQQADLEGGTFTISNLGMYGVDEFIAVLNPPQAAILAVGAIEERAVVRAGEIVARPVMSLTLTCDHRALDGATAADFLRSVRSFLEEPALML